MDLRITALDSPLFVGIHLFLKAGEEVLGGLVGEPINTRCILLSHLWVGEELRGQGWGTQLLTYFEQAALRQGFQEIQLETFDYQAPIFYEKKGYHCIERVEGQGFVRFRYAKESRDSSLAQNNKLND